MWRREEWPIALIWRERVMDRVGTENGRHGTASAPGFDMVRGRLAALVVATWLFILQSASTISAFHFGCKGLAFARTLPASHVIRHLNTHETRRAQTKTGRAAAIRQPGSLAAVQGQAIEAVTELLEIVSPGLEGQYSAEQRQRIDELLEVLDSVGKGGRFMEEESINDYYRVQFTRDVARGKPVGGQFRYSALGCVRLLSAT